MIHMAWKKAWPWLRGLVFILAALYLGQKLIEGWSEKKMVFGHFNSKLFIFSTIILSLAFPLLPITSKMTAELFHVNLPMKVSFQSYFYSQIGKYLPGGIWSYVARVYFFHKEGINKREAFYITILELIFLCISGFFCFLISFYFWKKIPDISLILSSITFLLVTLCAFSPYFYKIIPAVLRRFGFRFDLKCTPKKIGLILIIYICFWEMVGVGFYFLIISITPFSWEMILVFGGVYPLAWIMGRLIFFMPAGIGIREGALVYLLSFFLAPTQAVWISLVSRLWWVVAELFCALIVLTYGLLSRAKT